MVKQQKQQPKQPSSSSSSAQVSAPTYHTGRRLIQMLFRSSNCPEETSLSSEDPPRKQSLNTLPSMQKLALDQRHEEGMSREDEEKRRVRSRSMEEVEEMLDPQEDQGGSSWRNQLKRKLFPRKRRHPARIPPLSSNSINSEGVSSPQSSNGTPTPVDRINSYGRLPDLPSSQLQQDTYEDTSGMEETQVEPFYPTSTIEDMMNIDLPPPVIEVETTLEEVYYL
jgi:hypothetical protein